MRILFLLVISFGLFFSCYVSAYKPTPADTLVVKTISSVLEKKIDDNVSKAQEYKRIFELLANTYQTQKPRISYICEELAGFLVDAYIGDCGECSLGLSSPNSSNPSSDSSGNSSDSSLFTTIYEVGPSKQFTSLDQVPRENLQAGTKVNIYHKSTPYRAKFVVAGKGTKKNPILIQGIPGPDGQLPVIQGNGAKTRTELDFRNQKRGIVKIGGSSKPNIKQPTYITIANLDIQQALPKYSFTDEKGQSSSFAKNAACVYIERGKYITIKNNILHQCGNGIFSSHESENILVQANHIYDNGIDGDYHYHNTYTESKGIVYEYNYFGYLGAGAEGNNLKDRSAGTIVRYNIIDGGNRQLDLVDAGHSDVKDRADYQTTNVYGNLLIEREDPQGNSQIVHYGGDSGKTDNYRKGGLKFHDNTVISQRDRNTTLVRLSTQDAKAKIENNTVMVTAGPGRLAITNGEGQVNLHNNILPSDYKCTHSATCHTKITESDNQVRDDLSMDEILNEWKSYLIDHAPDIHEQNWILKYRKKL